MATPADARYKLEQREADKALLYKYPKFEGDVFKQSYVTYTDGSKYEITATGLKKIRERDERKRNNDKR